MVWGEGFYGGMEHHPYWHVASDAMDNEETHAHEAAHGWFGDGIRLRCLEDFVLSEGTVSYLAARSVGQIVGAEAEAKIWDGYRTELPDDRLSATRVAVTTTWSATAAMRSVKSCVAGADAILMSNAWSAKPFIRARS